MEDLFKKIVNDTEHKTSFPLIVSDNKTRCKTRFDPLLQLERDKKYEIALVNLETYYSFPNIDASNNMFIYSPDNDTSWVKLRIPEGSYDLANINYTIHQEMGKRGHHDVDNEEYYINISANTNTRKSVLNHQNSIAKVL